MMEDMEVPEGNDFWNTPQVPKGWSDPCLEVIVQSDHS